MISGNNYLDLTGRITLEKGVSLGPGVIIMTHNRYNFNAFLEERLSHTCGVKDVVIKEGAGIKAGALIVHGITIGRNAVVAGGAVVNRDVPDNCLVAGVPARTLKEIK
jgi:acetyltransferase-like isoleucine patch superfamily enzyme